MRGNAINPDIYDDDTTRGITFPIIRDGRQYFRYYLMTYAFTGNILEGQIAVPTPTLGFLVNQLSMSIRIRVSGIDGNYRVFTVILYG